MKLTLKDAVSHFKQCYFNSASLLIRELYDDEKHEPLMDELRGELEVTLIEPVGQVTLSLQDVDYIDELIEDCYKDQFHLTDVETSVLEYAGDDDYTNNLKTLSLKVNALRESLLFEDQVNG